MRFDWNTWEEILTTLTRNKTRSLLTAFGVFWGIFMLIVLIGLGSGLRSLMGANFEGAAQNTLYVMSGPTTKPYKGFQTDRYWDLVDTDMDKLQNGVPEIDKICPIGMRWETATFNEFMISANILGTIPDYAALEEQELSYGRFINEIDLHEARKVCVIGKRIYGDLFGGKGDPTGKSIEIKGVYYQVIGVANAEPSINIGGNASHRITIPITTMQSIYNMGNKLNFFFLNAKDDVIITDIQDKIGLILKEEHYIDPTDDQAITFLNSQAMYSMINNLFKGINSLSWLVGFGTLLAGVIGVSNIMMVTVRERTTEIGIRRAIGALPRDILTQVLLESIVLTIISGLVGIVMAVLVLTGVESGVNADRLIPVDFQVSFGLALSTCLALIILGGLAGLAPAYRAMAINPIDAIQND